MLIHELNGGTYFEPNSTTFEEWVRREWLPVIKSRVKPSTHYSYERNLELHVPPGWVGHSSGS